MKVIAEAWTTGCLQSNTFGSSILPLTATFFYLFLPPLPPPVHGKQTHERQRRCSCQGNSAALATNESLPLWCLCLTGTRATSLHCTETVKACLLGFGILAPNTPRRLDAKIKVCLWTHEILLVLVRELVCLCVALQKECPAASKHVEGPI